MRRFALFHRHVYALREVDAECGIAVSDGIATLVVIAPDATRSVMRIAEAELGGSVLIPPASGPDAGIGALASALRVFGCHHIMADVCARAAWEGWTTERSEVEAADAVRRIKNELWKPQTQSTPKD